MQRFHGLPSPAMAVAFLALFLVLGGSAVALKGKNRVDSGDIKNNTIRGKDVRNRTLTGKDVKDDRLTGADIDESSLDKVPLAGAADSATSSTTATTAAAAATAGNASAVSGQAVRKFSLQLASNAAAVEPVNVGGLKLTASCPSGNPTLNVSETAAATNFITIEGKDAVGGDFVNTGDFSGTELTPQAFTATEGAGNADIGWLDGRAATIAFGYRDDGFTAAGDCTFFGHVLAG